MVYHRKREISTIKISKKVVGELSKLKIHPRQAYEEVIIKLLEFAKKGKIFGNISEKTAEKREITTIKISKKTIEDISKLKIHPRQAYEEVIVKLLDFYMKNGI